MKLLVTGATGFIGKNLVAKLVDEGHDVTINLLEKEKTPFAEGVSTYKLNEDDIGGDSEYLKQQAFDGVIHLASLYLTVHEPEDAVKLIDSNVRFGTHVLECSARAKTKWFINTGTFWQHYQNADYSPVNLYAASKQAFESIARYYIETTQIKFCTVRLSDTFGPNDTRPKIFNLWDKIARTGATLDMSPGEQIIDISYIDDIVLAFSLLAQHLNSDHPNVKTGDVFAVRAERRFTLKELSKEYEAVTGCKLNINWGARAYREREVMVPWQNGRRVPGWKQSSKINENIERLRIL